MLNFRYHQFRATPPTGINVPMTNEPETNNPYDRFACLVKAPAQDHLQGRYLEFSGVTFGRVPKNICNVISVEKRKQILLRARCVFLGHMVHDGQQRGGGSKLVCMYLLEYKNNVNIHEVGNHLRRYVNEDFIFMWMFVSEHWKGNTWLWLNKFIIFIKWNEIICFVCVSVKHISNIQTKKLKTNFRISFFFFSLI